LKGVANYFYRDFAKDLNDKRYDMAMTALNKGINDIKSGSTSTLDLDVNEDIESIKRELPGKASEAQSSEDKIS
jgi:hypothetical protein